LINCLALINQKFSKINVRDFRQNIKSSARDRITGISIREISGRVGSNGATVLRCWSRWSEEGTLLESNHGRIWIFSIEERGKCGFIAEQDGARFYWAVSVCWVNRGQVKYAE
jgi:hypothetical protein